MVSLKKEVDMKKIANLLVCFGVIMLIIAAISRFIVGQPFSLLGVRALSLIAIANTAFLLGLVLKCGK